MRTRLLGDVATFFSGFAWKSTRFSDIGCGPPVIRIQNVDAVRQSDFVYWPDEYSSQFLVKSGDMLLTLSGSFRVALWSGPDALLNQRIVRVEPQEGIDKRWLYFALRSALGKIEEMGRHALVNNVALSDLRNLKVSVPPIEEQRHIAAILDQADSLRRLRQRAIDRVNSLGQAIFYEMFEGTDRFPAMPLENVADLKRGPFGGALKKEIFVDNGYKVYEQSHAINKTHSLGSYFIDDFKFKEMSAFAVQENDLIVSCSGTLGRVYRIPSDAPSGVINQALLRVRPNENIVTPEYLEHFLESQRMQAFLNGFSRGTGLQNFPPMSDVREISVPVPPKKVQLDFLGRMQSINGQRTLLDKSTTGLARLFSSLQHRAFRGEL